MARAIYDLRNVDHQYFEESAEGAAHLHLIVQLLDIPMLTDQFKRTLEDQLGKHRAKALMDELHVMVQAEIATRIMMKAFVRVEQ